MGPYADQLSLSDFSPFELNAALILVQMKTGLSPDEFERTYQVPEYVQEALCEPQPTTLCAVVPARVNVAKKKTSPNGLAANNVIQIDVPKRKRTRPSKLSDSELMPPPPKRSKIATKQVDMEGPTTTVIDKASIPRAIGFTLDSAVLLKLRSTLKSPSARMYLPPFFEHYISKGFHT